MHTDNCYSCKSCFGHSAGFQEAFLHPVLGWDQLVAMFAVGMIAVGMIAVRFQGWQAGALPTIFVLMLFLASMAVTALQVPLGDGAESLVLLSVVMLCQYVRFAAATGMRKGTCTEMRY